MSTEVLRRRYLWKNEHGQVIETPQQMFRRVADSIASVEAKYGASDSQVKSTADEFYRLMDNSRFLPNSPTLMNTGRKNGMLWSLFPYFINTCEAVNSD